MLTSLRFFNRFFVHHSFKIQTYTNEDYRTMCHLLKEKYMVHNEQIRAFKDIKLLDENNKLIGIYPASEARKKAYNMKKDIALINANSQPVICRAVEFRNNLLNKFFDEIVYKHNEKLLSRANATKQLKIALNLNQNQLTVKAKQIIELAKKNLKVRVFMNCKEQTRDECLEKLQYVKHQIQNKCLIERDIKNYREEDNEGQQIKKNQTQTYSFICKSRENQFLEMLKESSEKAPDQAISNFLKKYYKQEDVEMLDLKVTGSSIEEGFTYDQQKMQQGKKKKNVKNEALARTKGKGVYPEGQEPKENYIEREAKARILNERLKVLLGWTA